MNGFRREEGNSREDGADNDVAAAVVVVVAGRKREKSCSLIDDCVPGETSHRLVPAFSSLSLVCGTEPIDGHKIHSKCQVSAFVFCDT